MKPTYSGVVATLALAVALGGTSYAAATLPKNSVTGKQVKNESVTGKDIKDGSLSAADFGGTLPSGPQGLPGPQGTQGIQGVPGTPGTARGYARVGADGTIDPATSKGVNSVTLAGLSLFCFDLGFAPKNVVAIVQAYASDQLNNEYGIAVGGLGDGGFCAAGTDAYVATSNLAESSNRYPVLVVFN